LWDRDKVEGELFNVSLLMVGMPKSAQRFAVEMKVPEMPQAQI